MQVTNIIDEDVVNYKEVSMFVSMPFCDGKCWKELGLPSSICQNNHIRNDKLIYIDTFSLVARYMSNELSKAVVFGGLEPLESLPEIIDFIKQLRAVDCNDTVVIYTGYKEDEDKVLRFKHELKQLNISNVIIKVGRYIPNNEGRYDELLGVKLASDNQYAIQI